MSIRRVLVAHQPRTHLSKCLGRLKIVLLHKMIIAVGQPIDHQSGDCVGDCFSCFAEPRHFFLATNYDRDSPLTLDEALQAGLVD